MTHSTAIQSRVMRTSKTPLLKRWRLVTWLVEIGVKVDGLPTREHIKQAHRLFRGARGESVHINNLWSKIKHHVCPVCDGVKLRDKFKTCSQVCGLMLRDGKAVGVATMLLASTPWSGAQTLSSLPQPVASLAPTVNPNLGSVTLAWTHSPSSNVTSYSVQYGTNRTALNSSTGVGYVTNVTVTGIYPAATYYFTVTARDAAGVDSAPSNMVTNFIQPRMVMLPDRWKVWLALPAGRTSIVQSCTNANFAGTILNLLTNSSGGSIWFYATNDATRNFYRVRP
jgi:hypothetical protein